MTTKERLRRLVRKDRGVSSIAAGGEGASETNDIMDEWGDLDAWTDVASRDTMRMLDDEDAAIGFSWEQRKPR